MQQFKKSNPALDDYEATKLAMRGVTVDPAQQDREQPNQNPLLRAGGLLVDGAKAVGMGATVGVGGAIFDAAGFTADLLGGALGSSQLENVGYTYRQMAQRAQDSMDYFGPQATSGTGKAIVSGLQSAGTNLAMLPLGPGPGSGVWGRARRECHGGIGGHHHGCGRLQRSARTR
ncbi:MAG: hypothetical protein U5O12_00530 [Rhodoferax sp.]|nr:hypothetical protein [Rhodoferax sp.]